MIYFISPWRQERDCFLWFFCSFFFRFYLLKTIFTLDPAENKGRYAKETTCCKHYSLYDFSNRYSRLLIVTERMKSGTYYFVVNQSIGSECSHNLHMSQVGGNRLVVCGQVNGQYRLTLYDLQDEDLCSTTLKDEPGGVSRIKLGGKHCIAVSYP